MSKRGITLNNCLGEGVSVADRGKGFIQINGRGVLLPEGEAIRLRDWLNAKYPAPPAAAHGSKSVNEKWLADLLESHSDSIELLRKIANAGVVYDAAEYELNKQLRAYLATIIEGEPK